MGKLSVVISLMVLSFSAVAQPSDANEGKVAKIAYSKGHAMPLDEMQKIMEKSLQLNEQDKKVLMARNDVLGIYYYDDKR